jgi:hypothetical protein
MSDTTDGMELVAGIAAVKTSVDLLSKLREALRTTELKPEEILTRLAEMQDMMLNARMALLDAKEQESLLKARVAELERVHDIGGKFTDEEGVYWYANHPYCVNCWDAGRKPIRLEGPYRIANTQNSPNRRWTCPIHKTVHYLRARS